MKNLIILVASLMALSSMANAQDAKDPATTCGGKTKKEKIACCKKEFGADKKAYKACKQSK